MRSTSWSAGHCRVVRSEMKTSVPWEWRPSVVTLIDRRTTTRNITVAQVELEIEESTGTRIIPAFDFPLKVKNELNSKENKRRTMFYFKRSRNCVLNGCPASITMGAAECQLLESRSHKN